MFTTFTQRKLSLRRVIVIAGIAAIGATGLTIFGSATQEAHADLAGNRCWRASCDFKDPVDMGCDDTASTPAGGTVYISGYYAKMKIEYRYSTGCNASWTRATLYDEAPNLDCVAFRGVSAVHRRHWYNSGATFNSDLIPHRPNCQRRDWTYMTGSRADGSVGRRACGIESNSQSETYHCTSWHRYSN